jgi:hypothetical protein
MNGHFRGRSRERGHEARVQASPAQECPVSRASDARGHGDDEERTRRVHLAVRLFAAGMLRARLRHPRPAVHGDIAAGGKVPTGQPRATAESTHHQEHS